MTYETLITILTIENLNPWQYVLPDNYKWHWTAFAILAMFLLIKPPSYYQKSLSLQNVLKRNLDIIYHRYLMLINYFDISQTKLLTNFFDIPLRNLLTFHGRFISEILVDCPELSLRRGANLGGEGKGIPVIRVSDMIEGKVNDLMRKKFWEKKVKNKFVLPPATMYVYVHRSLKSQDSWQEWVVGWLPSSSSFPCSSAVAAFGIFVQAKIVGSLILVLCFHIFALKYTVCEIYIFLS